MSSERIGIPVLDLLQRFCRPKVSPLLHAAGLDVGGCNQRSGTIRQATSRCRPPDEHVYWTTKFRTVDERDKN